MKNRRISTVPAIFLTVLLALSGCAAEKVSEKPAHAWQWKLGKVVRHPPAGVVITGNPQIARTNSHGSVVRFNGQDDGIFYDHDPVSGWSKYTIEMIFRPDPDCPFAQRIINLGSSRGPRITIEIRNTGTRWYLDAFMASRSKLTLVDSTRLHRDGEWYNVALTVDSGRMRTFVNRKPELSGKVSFTPLPEGKSSFGTRLNHQYWFKGDIREIRISPAILDTAHFLSFAAKDSVSE